MIPTRLHGLIDYGVSAALGLLAAAPALPAPTRRALGTAALYHPAYSLLTDYEGGVRPVFSMRQHLAMDALGGAALVAAGLAMGRRAGAARWLVVGVGLTELAVVALSDDAPRRGPGQGAGPVTRLLDRADAHGAHPRATYPPLDVPKPVAEDVFVVDGAMPNALGAVFGVRMTVIRLPNGGLLLHSPTRSTPALRRALAAIGPVRHLVAPSFAHWTFVKEWQDALPEATTWAAPGLRDRAPVRRSGLRLDHDLDGTPPPEWGGAVKVVIVPGGAGFHEAALFHAPTRTLVLTDLVISLEAPKVPPLLRPLVRLFGSMAPDGMPPPYLRAIIRRRHAEAAAAAGRLVALEPERVIFAHGRPFERDGTARLRHSLRWLLPG